MFLTNTIPMKATDIKTIEDAQRYIEGCINDLDAGISTKQQTIDYFAEYTLLIVKMAQKNTLLDDFPDNKPLCYDSGLWQMRSDDMEEILVKQGVNETIESFINRCKL